MERSPACLFMVCACMAAAIAARAETPVDLTTAWEHALGYQRELQAKRHLLDAEREAVAQARAAWRPEIRLEGAYGHHRERVECNRTDIDGTLLDPGGDAEAANGPPPVDSDGYGSARAGLHITQALFDRERRVAGHAARQQVTVAELQWEAIRRRLLHDVIVQQVAVVESDEIAHSLRREYEALSEQSELDAERHARGIGTLTEVRHAESRLLLTEAELLHAEQTRDAERLAWQRLTGLTSSTPMALDAGAAIELAAALDDVAWDPEGADAIGIARAEEEAAAIAIRSARSRYGPVLELIASRDHLENRPNTVTTVSEEVRNRIMLQLRMPLYAGGALRSGTREAVARHHAATERTRETEIDGEHELQHALDGLRSARRRVEVLERAVARSGEAVELHHRALRQGLITNHEVLDATRERHQAERALLVARYDAIRHFAALRLATGELSVADLALLQPRVTGPATAADD